ncbi:MAG: SAM-dependent methyltransferase [Flavobacteriaceae bacterium]|nr:SAM-dependent methyltransferase [Flavobacteriaceae bacterium]|tara:strand:- start:204079 stop:204801 length:723 start_codon:yes stop_codon:yes gene_type:complete
MKEKDWYKNWFNTPYYHILYKDRNDEEAELFIRKITGFLNLPTSTHILDLPCGKGRHSKFLNSLGYKVTGADLSENSIAFAKQFENEKLSFKVHDMRVPFVNNYDVIANLFTSFGYFDNNQNKAVLKNIKNALNPKGYFIFDFLNAKYIKENLISNEMKVVDSIPFYIERSIANGEIVKNISFRADDQNFSFSEVVKYLDFTTLKNMLEEVGFEISSIFGDYELNTFHEDSSERVVIIAQ